MKKNSFLIPSNAPLWEGYCANWASLQKGIRGGLFLLFVFLFTGAYAWSGDIIIQSPATEMVLHADEGSALKQQYFGPRITSAEVAQLVPAGMSLGEAAYPAFGQTDMTNLYAIQVLHNDGQLTLYPTVDDVTTMYEGHATITQITMTDKQYPVTVKLFYKAYSTVDMIETWAEISHTEKKAITLKRYDSGHLVIPQGDVWMTHFHGDWSAEFYPTTERVTSGLKIIRNSDGDRNAHLDAPEIMISLDGRPHELTGRVIGAALCWNGNFQLRMDTKLNRYHHFFAGIGIARQLREKIRRVEQSVRAERRCCAHLKSILCGIGVPDIEELLITVLQHYLVEAVLFVAESKTDGDIDLDVRCLEQVFLVVVVLASCRKG